MKVHYINMLLFALPLNILKHNQRNHKSTTLHTQNNRSLCECELYAPANYDSDTEMKRVMENFSKQTQHRFHEYDERMKTTRQKCREQCDKEIQKIILKDKLEKELMDKFATLQTDIQNDAIPTCVCEKSLADKVEKGCLKCAQNLGGIVAPSTGVLGEIAALAVNAWKTTELEAAIVAAQKAGDAAGVAAGEAAGKKAVIEALEFIEVHKFFPGIFKNIRNITHYADVKNFVGDIVKEHAQNCALVSTNEGAKCYSFEVNLGIREAITFKQTGPPASGHIRELIKGIVGDVKKAADARTAEVSSATYKDIMTKQTAFIEAEFNSSITSIYAPIIAIVVIVLIMIIIYLILRYRRKKKMKKKLQYIKLLEE
ncbi:rifin [Plasmodium falciparum RAJ116]|uniref:Rifin n=1 Tax=Plasmodium falciparum RAJ116 TaxID=580058 RepID=A0A0L0CTN4_PLAFA|nr:rifin [Plasmodium falciparum RAJ116]